ncbi:unnamed protein product, partial [Amoebophrya sp. A120]
IQQERNRFDLKEISMVYTGTPKIFLYGDSLTQYGSSEVGGWAARLQGLYSRRADVVNRGLSGWNSRWAREYVDGVVSRDLGND